VENLAITVTSEQPRLDG